MKVHVVVYEVQPDTDPAIQHPDPKPAQALRWLATCIDPFRARAEWAYGPTQAKAVQELRGVLLASRRVKVVGEPIEYDLEI